MKKKFFVEVIYEDGSEFSFYVLLDGSDNKMNAELLMITRGTLMGSGGCKAVAYNEDGFDVCSFVR